MKKCQQAYDALRDLDNSGLLREKTLKGMGLDGLREKRYPPNKKEVEHV